MAVKQHKLLAVLVLPGVVILAAAGISLAQSGQSWPEPARVIYPGEVIKDEMLVDGPVTELTESGPVASERRQVAGKVARRTLLPHHPIVLAALGDKALVVSGHIVTASFAEGLLTIAAKVMALQDGRPGDLIEARSLDSGKIIVGVVEADGNLKIPAP